MPQEPKTRKCNNCLNILDDSAFGWAKNGICNGCSEFQKKDMKCTCGFSDDTAAEIGHFNICPMAGTDTRYEHFTPPTKDWGIEFDEKFVYVPPPESHESGGTLLRPHEWKGEVTIGNVKSFIEQLLSRHTQELRKGIEGLDWERSTVDDRSLILRDDILALLRERENKV